MRTCLKLALTVAALSLVASACTATVSDSDTTQPTEAAEAARQDTEATESETSSEAGGRDFSVVDQLGLVPVSALEDGTGFVSVSTADIGAAADIARVRRPADPRNSDQAVDFAGPLRGFHPAGLPLRTYVDFPASFGQNLERTDEIVDELGFSVGQVETFVTVNALPGVFTVVSGVDAPPGLPEVAPGITTLGEGDDFQFDPARPTAVRGIGRPLRFGERDDFVVMSRSTPPVEDWLANNYQALADDPHLAAMAETLDEFEVVSAVFSWSEEMAAVGMGWGEDDQAPFAALVWSFDTSDIAAQESQRIADALNGESLLQGIPIADLFTTESVEQRDATVIAFVRFPEGSRPIAPLELLYSADGPYA